MKDKQNYTPLDTALRYNSMAIVVELFLAKKPDLWDFLGAEKSNVLFGPVYFHNLDMIQLVVKKAPQELIEESCQSTSLGGGLLHYAVQKQDIELAKTLLTFNDHLLKLMMHKNEKGETPFEVAITLGNNQILDLFAQRGIKIER